MLIKYSGKYIEIYYNLKITFFLSWYCPVLHPCLDYSFELFVADVLDRLLDFSLGWTLIPQLPLRRLGRFVAVPVGVG